MHISELVAEGSLELNHSGSQQRGLVRYQLSHWCWFEQLNCGMVQKSARLLRVVWSRISHAQPSFCICIEQRRLISGQRLSKLVAPESRFMRRASIWPPFDDVFQQQLTGPSRVTHPTPTGQAKARSEQLLCAHAITHGENFPTG